MRRVLFCLLVFTLPALSQWRTGYSLEGETASTIPWSKYTHVVQSGALAAGTDVAGFVNGAHGAGVQAIAGIVADETYTAPWNIGQFVDTIGNFVAVNHYDGVDIDWAGGIVAPQYQDLVRRLRTAMPTATLSVTVGLAERFLTAAVQDDLDQIHIRAYDLDSTDLSGSAIPYTWYHAATLQGANVQDQAMDILAWYYVSAGNAASKIGIVAPFYGRIRQGCLDSTGTVGVTDPNQTWVGGAGTVSIGYRDLVNSTYWSLGTRVWDDARKSQYIRYGSGSCATDAFISFVGPEQLQDIAALVKTNGLGGIATYGLALEYSPAEAGDARYPLSSAMYDAMAAPASAAVTTPITRDFSNISRASMPMKRTSNRRKTPPSIVTSSPMPSALTGAAYSRTLVAAGTTPITWAVTGGTLPAGLTLGSSTGTIGGTPTAAGVSTLTVRATNAAGSNSKQLRLTVTAAATPPSITTSSPLPDGVTGAADSKTLMAGGTTPITWAVTSGTLPAGLSLGSSTGILSGTPTAAGPATFTVRATNAVGSNSKQLSLTVKAAATPPSIGTTSPLPSAVTGAAYSQALVATGTTPITWAVTSGTVPAGLTLGSSTGLISGTPTAAGAATFTISATNAAGSNSKQLSLTVNAAATVTVSVTPATISLSASQTQQFTATVAGSANTGVTWTLNPAVGTISTSGNVALYAAPGVITATQTVEVSAISVADSSKLSKSVVTLIPAILVSLAPISINLQQGQTQQFAAAVSGTTNQAVTWALSPAVGTISSAGLYTAPAVISTSQNLAVIAISVADASKSASGIVVLTPVNAPATPPSIVTSSPLPSAVTGAAYSQTLIAGGTTPITWAVTSGTLPAGLSLGSSSGILSGTPTAAGVFTLTVSATNTAGSNSKQLSLTVNAAPTPPSIGTTSPLPSAVTGTAYSQTLVAGGTTPITWAVTGGTLPAGLSLGSSTGILSGTPTAAGVFTLTVSATNAVGSNSKQLSLTVNAAPTPPSIATSSPLPSAVTGTAYSQTLMAGGTTPMTWAVTSRTLPTGLSLGSSTGILSGTPTAAGVFTFTASATNAGGSNSKQLSLTVNDPPTPPSIATSSPLPSALTGTAYSQTLMAGGTTPITWAVTGGTLPAGLSLGSSTGFLSGTPTAAGVFTLTVGATNAVGSDAKQLSLTVNAAPTPPSIVTSSPLPTAVTGTAYSQALVATGTTPITWAVTGGTLPAGLSLGSANGLLSGTPTGAGVFTFTVSATNAGGSNSKQLSLTVNVPATPPSIVTTSPLPNALTGAAYSQPLVATGTTPITWAVTSGTLPAGLSLGSATGILSGTPAAAGVSTLTVSATNAGGSNSKQLSLTVNPAPTPPGQWSMGYWSPPGGADPVSTIQWNGLTHINQITAIANTDGTLDLATEQVSSNAAGLISAAHAHNVKVLLMIVQHYNGTPTTNFHQAISRNLTAFVGNIMTVVNTYGYDGVDIDWEPFDSETADGTDMATFASALRTALGSRILTAAAYYWDGPYWTANHIPFDRVNVMTYDMTSASESTRYAWFNSPLYNDGVSWRPPSLDVAVNTYYLPAGFPAAKLGLGLAFYGWKWTGGVLASDPTQGISGPRQVWKTGNAPTGIQIRYNAILALITQQNYTWDPQASVPYINHLGSTPSTYWYLTYDNPQSIQAKVRYIIAHGLGGWIIWNLNGDYIAGDPHPHPLLDAVQAVFR